MSDLIQLNGRTAKIEFDKIRKLKPTHGAISNALAAASRDLGRQVSVGEMVVDVFNGQRYLLQALLAPALASNENLTLNRVSELVDIYRDKGGTVADLQHAMTAVLADYLGIEMAADDEDDDPNATAPVVQGPDAG